MEKEISVVVFGDSQVHRSMFMDLFLLYSEGSSFTREKLEKEAEVLVDRVFELCDDGKQMVENDGLDYRIETLVCKGFRRQLGGWDLRAYDYSHLKMPHLTNIFSFFPLEDEEVNAVILAFDIQRIDAVARFNLLLLDCFELLPKALQDAAVVVFDRCDQDEDTHRKRVRDLTGRRLLSDRFFFFRDVVNPTDEGAIAANREELKKLLQYVYELPTTKARRETGYKIREPLMKSKMVVTAEYYEGKRILSHEAMVAFVYFLVFVLMFLALYFSHQLYYLEDFEKEIAI